MNNYSVIGRLTRDPVLRPVGDSRVANFDIAVDTGTKNKPKTMFLPCSAWGRTADLIEEYVAKGHRIGISGRLDMETWQDKETGGNRSKIVLVADRIDLLQSRNPEDQRPTGQRESSYGEEAQTQPADAGSVFDSEPVPF